MGFESGSPRKSESPEDGSRCDDLSGYIQRSEELVFNVVTVVCQDYDFTDSKFRQWQISNAAR